MKTLTAKSKISYTLLAINTIPLILLGILIMFLSSGWFSNTMYKEIEVELKSVASTIVTMLDTAYPGDYALKGETIYDFYKGEHNLSSDTPLIDHIKEETGLEITVFYEDVRILTTLRNLDGQRISGTAASETIRSEVLNADKAQFYDNAMINGAGYFSYYMPLHNSDGAAAGILFVGKPRKAVDAAVENTVYPLLAADILSALVIAAVNFIYNRRLAQSLLKIHSFMSEVSSGNLSARLDSSVLRRSDELQQIGYSAIHMQRTLTNMIDQDSLTELLNRRSADRRLRQIIANSQKEQTPFCVAIGDIDFFKRVNDTYGHECGDVVLKNIAACLKRHMAGKGFAARWGGEEFLLVYEHMNIRDAYRYLQRLNFEIHDLDSCFEGKSVHITMTFGLVPGDTDDISQLLRNADQKLYDGKAAGRDCIMC